MAKSQESRKGPAEGARLLYRALRGLSEHEQEVVFEYLLERGIGTGVKPRGYTAEIFGQEGVERTIRLGSIQGTIGQALGPDQQMVPVRLSEAQHRRLKDWCGEHGFSMAVVIRGLIDRFLDDWERRAA